MPGTSRSAPDGPSLFDAPDVAERSIDPSAPLAVRMRPRELDELVGQAELVAPGSPLRRLIEGSGTSSVILWGPPGTGKTTIASLVSRTGGRRFVELSAVTAGVKDVRTAIDTARISGVPTVLFIDEVHRFTRTQQDALLPGVENGWVTLVAATTENPSFSVVSPLLSRSLLLMLRSLTDDEVGALIDRAVADERGLAGRVRLAEDARADLIRFAGGDARRALTYLEAAAHGVTPTADPSEPVLVRAEEVAVAVQRALVRYDRAGDQHYDVISAFIKSVRGSDPDAAIHYLARMIEAGEDPRFIARRLVILASEDVGMADPSALGVAVAAMTAAQQIGLPEARLPLAQATVHLALAPKSNAVIRAIDGAAADVRAGRVGAVPPHLRDGHHPGAASTGVVGYQYPHDDPAGVLAQQYAPDVVRGRRYYVPTDHGVEARLGPLADRLRATVDGVAPESAPDAPATSAPPGPGTPASPAPPDAPEAPAPNAHHP
ncbi:MAG TPA: replication-associated recombination protein A [Candidatus Nanopelagicales bacterium]